MPDFKNFYLILRKLCIVWQLRKWNHIAQRAVRDYDPHGTQVALAQLDQLNHML